MCGNACPPENLHRKKVDFLTLGGTGRRSRVVKSRTESWLCPVCLAKDPVWQMEAHTSPGMRSPALDRVRAAQARESSNGNNRSTGDRSSAAEAKDDGTSSA